MTAKVPFREYWHRRIASVRAPSDRLNRTFDYLRSVIGRLPQGTARDAVADITRVIRDFADDLESEIPKEGK